jgi:hypothetical protein
MIGSLCRSLDTRPRSPRPARQTARVVLSPDTLGFLRQTSEGDGRRSPARPSTGARVMSTPAVAALAAALSFRGPRIFSCLRRELGLKARSILRVRSAAWRMATSSGWRTASQMRSPGPDRARSWRSSRPERSTRTCLAALSSRPVRSALVQEGVHAFAEIATHVAHQNQIPILFRAHLLLDAA